MVNPRLARRRSLNLRLAPSVRSQVGDRARSRLLRQRITQLPLVRQAELGEEVPSQHSLANHPHSGWAPQATTPHRTSSGNPPSDSRLRPQPHQRQQHRRLPCQRSAHPHPPYPRSAPLHKPRASLASPSLSQRKRPLLCSGSRRVPLLPPSLAALAVAGARVRVRAEGA